jgi:hypothetical protein
MIETESDNGVSNAQWTRIFSLVIDDLAKPLLNGATPD